MFCETCCSLLQRIQQHPEEGEGQHHGSYASFNNAIARNCAICKRFQRECKDSESEDQAAAFCIAFRYGWEVDISEPPVFRSTMPARTVQIRLARDTNSPILPWDGIRLNLVPVESDQRSYGDTGHHLSSNTGSKECLTLACKWLRTCFETHSTCNPPLPKSLRDWNPSRLIWVGQAYTKGVRLREAGSLPSRVQYTTLSHCWGQNLVRSTLTQHNRVSWLEAIPDCELMQTFKDAIKVTRNLSVEYIWIDSLCIIQDSESDWVLESSCMSHIYKYSRCNIAATAAENDSIGCFRNRDPVAALPVRFDFSDLAPDISQLSLREESARHEGRRLLEGLHDVQWQRPWLDEIGDAPLCDRAWIVQERLLSPRILHFSKTQLCWQCNELQACESYPFGMPAESSAQFDFKSSSPLNLQRNQFEDGHDKSETLLDRHRDLFDTWAIIVEAYSQAKLTKEGDKLIALSAIAREMQPLMQCRYLAGHWEMDLIRQLGWPGNHIEGRATTYRAPSWSWASTNGMNKCFKWMYRYMDQYYPMVEIKDVGVDLAGEDPMGPVKGGHLNLSGQLYHVEIQEKRDLHGQRLTISGRDTKLRFYKDGWNTKLEPGPLYCMMLFVCLGDELTVQGLILQPSGPPNTYQRVGTVGHASKNRLSKEDPVIGLLGKVEWSDDDNHKFHRHEFDLQSFTIV